MTLESRTLFISGASRGIGKAIALRAARDGANIVIASKTDKPHRVLPGTIHTAAQEIVEAGGQAQRHGGVVGPAPHREMKGAATDHIGQGLKRVAWPKLHGRAYGIPNSKTKQAAP